MDQQRLLRRASRGDERALEEFIRQHSDGVYAFLAGVLGESRAADVALGDTFVRLARSLDGDVSEDPEARVYRIARSVAAAAPARNGLPEVIVLKEMLGWDVERISRTLDVDGRAQLAGAWAHMTGEDVEVAPPPPDEPPPPPDEPPPPEEPPAGAARAPLPAEADALAEGDDAAEIATEDIRLRDAAKEFFPFVRPYWRGLVPGTVGVFASSLVSLVKPWPFKFLFDNVLHVGKHGGTVGAPTAVPTTLIVAIGAAIVGIAVLQGLVNYLKEFFLRATSERIAFEIRQAVFGHMQRLSLLFHDTKRTGDLVSRVTSDVDKVQTLVADDIIDSIAQVLQIAGMVVTMLVLNWKLGLIAVASAPLISFTVDRFRGAVKAQARIVRRTEADMTSVAVETIGAIRVVKAFGREEFETARFGEYNSEAMVAGVRASRLEAVFGWAVNVLGAVALATLVGLGAREVLTGALTAGTLVVFIQYMRDFQGPLQSLSKLTVKWAKLMARAERIIEVLHENPAVADRPGAVRAAGLRGDVRLDAVSFGYLPGRPVLRDVDLHIPRGQKVALVGPTGAGKTTLASLVLRLYDPVTGTVSVDGRDVREYALDSYIEQIAVVLQDSILFAATIRENIAYGRPGAGFNEIREAARAAYADEFVEPLPQGYDTVVGERGATLSGGQRQRIAIARALIRDAPILILDEPTTGLDAESEDIVLRALERLMEGRTTIMIAHKLSTARRSDRIYFLRDGRIAEQGSHDELVAAGGLYARAASLQTFELVPAEHSA